MKGIRRAVILMTIDRYFSMVINFVQIAILSRLLTPAEIGVSVIGVAITSISLAVRDFASAGYLIQKQNLTEDDKQTLFTVTSGLSIALACICWVLAPYFREIYGRPNIAIYLRSCAIAIVLEGVNQVVVAFMRRDLEFAKVAIVNVVNLLVGVIMVCVFAALGYSFLSFGYAWLCSVCAALLVAMLLKPAFSTFRLNLREWRGLLSFGYYNGLAAVLSRLYDALPLMLFGKTMGLQDTGVFFRAFSICQLPDKMFLAGVLQVALPALSRAAEAGHDMKSVYLRGVQQITALYWPALAMMAILAHPIVNLLLGAQWTAAVPLIQIMAIGWMFAFSNELSYSVLVSLGGIRDYLIRNAIIWPISGAVLVAASFHGPLAAAAGLAFTVPMQWFVSFLIMRRRMTIRFGEMFGSLKLSAVVTLATVAAPLAVIFGLMGGDFNMSLLQAIGLGLLSGVGWLAALVLLNHPMWVEVRGMLEHVGRRLSARLS